MKPSDGFTKYNPIQIWQLIQAFEALAKEPGMSGTPRFKARGSHLFRVWFQVQDRLKAGALYIDRHPEDIPGAKLYYELVDANTAINVVLSQHWTEDFRVTTAKLLFDMEEIELHDTAGESSAGRDESGPVHGTYRHTGLSQPVPVGPGEAEPDDGSEAGDTPTEAEPEGRRIGESGGGGDDSEVSPVPGPDTGSTG